MNRQKYPENIIFKADPETKRKLKVISASTERDMSKTIRWLINQEYNRLNGTITPNDNPQK
jgi:hypothetical protein